MKSRILSLSPSYSKFENILPDELIQTHLEEELELARDELKEIIKEDQENIKNLCIQQNKTIPFSDFINPNYIADCSGVKSLVNVCLISYLLPQILLTNIPL